MEIWLRSVNCISVSILVFYILYYIIALKMFSSVQFSRSVMWTLCDPMNCNTPGLHVHHQLLEMLLLEKTLVSHVAGRRFNLWATGEAPLEKIGQCIYSTISHSTMPSIKYIISNYFLTSNPYNYEMGCFHFYPEYQYYLYASYII